MKYGYSILLGEHIQSEQIDYEDCKAFQIVCPCCREPIFKVVRDSHAMPSTHYLSHYEKSAEYSSDCELRVNLLNRNDIARNNQVSRNQKLEFFLHILKDWVLKNEYGSEAGKLVGMISQMNRSKALRFLRERFHDYVTSNLDLSKKEHVYELLDEYINEMETISGGFPKTSFSIVTQKRIAFDVWTHLLSSNAKKNFDFMFNNAYLFLVFRIEKAVGVREVYEYEKRLHTDMLKLIRKPKEQGMQIISSMMDFDVPEPHSIGLDLLSKMLAEIQHEIFGCLLRVPYFEMLKDQGREKKE